MNLETTFWKHLKTFYFQSAFPGAPSDPLPQRLRFNFLILVLYKFIYLLTYFSIKVIQIWNSFPDSVIDVNNMNTLKNKRHKFWINEDVKFNWKSDLTGPCGARGHCRISPARFAVRNLQNYQLFPAVCLCKF